MLLGPLEAACISVFSCAFGPGWGRSFLGGNAVAGLGWVLPVAFAHQRSDSEEVVVSLLACLVDVVFLCTIPPLALSRTTVFGFMCSYSCFSGASRPSWLLLLQIHDRVLSTVVGGYAVYSSRTHSSCEVKVG